MRDKTINSWTLLILWIGFPLVLLLLAFSYFDLSAFTEPIKRMLGDLFDSRPGLKTWLVIIGTVTAGVLMALLLAKRIRRRLWARVLGRNALRYGREQAVYTQGIVLPEVCREEVLAFLEEQDPVSILNHLLGLAISSQASDIHISPQKEHSLIKFRIDGILHQKASLSLSKTLSLVNRIKVLSKLPIDIHNRPQDGSILLDQDHIVRVSLMPTAHGENVVLRLAIKDERRYQLENLGIPPALLQHYQACLEHDHGVIFLTGPTGSGKTTTMYASLLYLLEKRRDRVHIVTLEDPIEMSFDQISQTQISPAQGLTFASGARSITRQDPDVIMLGEVRDEETAQAAIQAGLTGHLLFTSVHAGNAIDVFHRLQQLEVDKIQLMNASLAVVNQRLAVCNCPACTVPVELTALQVQMLKALDLDARGPFYAGQGCEACGQSGFSGRVPLFELLEVSDPFRDLFIDDAPKHQLRELAQEQGLVPLSVQAMQLAQERRIPIAEVIRVLA
ncbi:MAG: type II/IV secretion system protein [Deltaproteobacteria bacterium]|nr:type II/IV secretion system protein [Deltaproteobacteria bacterium]